jgi:hypothetical protein
LKPGATKGESRGGEKVVARMRIKGEIEVCPWFDHVDINGQEVYPHGLVKRSDLDPMSAPPSKQGPATTRMKAKLKERRGSMKCEIEIQRRLGEIKVLRTRNPNPEVRAIYLGWIHALQWVESLS